MLTKLGRSKAWFLILTLAVGFYILAPLHDFQFQLSQGDHGRDLYSFKKTFEGAVPYRDYWTINGPLMPYYYSCFFHFLGVSIQSVLLGYYLLVLLIGVLIYLVCSVFLSPAISFACALWYWASRGQEFFYTYNHVGAIFLVLIVIYFLFQYLKNPRLIYVCLGSIAIVLLSFIRINIGITSLVGFFLSLAVYDCTKKDLGGLRKTLRYIPFAVAILVIVFAVYWALMHRLPKYALNLGYLQSLKGYHASFATLGTALLAMKNNIIGNISVSYANLFFNTIVIFSMVRIFLSGGNVFKKGERKNLFLALFSLVFFLLLSLHEFLASAVWFRGHWIISLMPILIFFIVDIGTRNLAYIARCLLLATLFLIPSLEIVNSLRLIKSCKTPENLLQIGANKIYLFPAQRRWTTTITAATNFIKENVPQNDKIIAIPYDSIYYFLSGRDSAVRELSLFWLEGQQEKDIIKNIEKEKVNYVIISNRAMYPLETRLEVFGQDYGINLAGYLDKNFKVTAAFGPWEKKAGWISDHAVKILKRIKQ